MMDWVLQNSGFGFFGSHNGPENLKKSRPKKLVKSNKSIHFTKFYLTKFHFFQFQKSIFEQGKSLKLPEMQFHEEKT